MEYVTFAFCIFGLIGLICLRYVRWARRGMERRK